jgi:lipopolysaccharide/colanic/teichoic acid biosynthesis glycosyltransferase
LYTIDIQFNIATPIQKRNKRALDVLLSLLMLPLLPLLVLISKRKFALIVAVFSVISGSQSWVAYAESNGRLRDLPKLKKGILKTTDGLNFQNLSETTINRLNFLYAKDYNPWLDIEILLKSIWKRDL